MGARRPHATTLGPSCPFGTWRRGTGGQHVRQRTRNPYVFRGLIYCAACDRRMQGQYSHGDAYYRCRFPQEYALANQVPHPRNVYLRENALTDPFDTWLATAFAPERIEQTITAMADAQSLDHPPQPQQPRRSSPSATPSCSGELDGSEPIDDPPAGFARWDEWRVHRWPRSVSWRPILAALPRPFSGCSPGRSRKNLRSSVS
ncbi:zinc ribbon domain-containing protein [Micromonospora sp. NPDC047527]|uniref:zinc ribbon domain-containing protein n=1 Tax=unclassified Micromonospora TaxID=2617518 RepID=UPI0033DD09EF